MIFLTKFAINRFKQDLNTFDLKNVLKRFFANPDQLWQVRAVKLWRSDSTPRPLPFIRGIRSGPKAKQNTRKPAENRTRPASISTKYTAEYFFGHNPKFSQRLRFWGKSHDTCIFNSRAEMNYSRAARRCRDYNGCKSCAVMLRDLLCPDSENFKQPRVEETSAKSARQKRRPKIPFLKTEAILHVGNTRYFSKSVREVVIVISIIDIIVPGKM